MTDFKKKFFLTVSGYHFGKVVSENNLNENVIDGNVLNDFISLKDNLTLFVSFTDQQEIRFHDKIGVSKDRILVFYKIYPCTLTDDNLLVSIQLISLTGSPTVTLYHSLHNVFVPLFGKQDRKSASHLAIQRQLANLQAGLRNAVLTPNFDVNPLQSVDTSTLSVILSLDHEIDYWNNVAKSAKGKEHRASTSFKTILEPLARDFSVIDALQLNDIEDLLENAHNTLDDLWRHEPPYPKIRIQNLMDLIANDLIKSVNKGLTGVNFWFKDFSEVSQLLQQSIALIKHWETSCKQLTEIFWPNYSLNAWTGDAYVPQGLLDLINRLGEVFDIRTIHKQLTRLLTTSEESELNTKNFFKPFEDMDVLDCGPHTETAWKTAFKKFEFLLQPAEERVAIKLKNQLSNMNTNTRQLLYEFGRYSELISRPVVKKILQSERQYLMTSLKDFVNQLSMELTAEPSANSKYDTPQIITKILTTRQLELKATDVRNILAKLLDDLNGYEKLNLAVIDLLRDIKNQHTELFDSWTSDVNIKIKDKTLSLRENDPVIQFSSNKMMRVNYSSQLVALIHEVRQLTALGYRIPASIQEISNHAEQFMKHAKILEQIANFHNTIGNRMIPSQRPMMLASAVELSQLVQQQEVVSWADVQSVEKYVENLKSAVDKLSKENDLLATYHFQALEKINALEDSDLIKYFQNWKETAKNLRDVISQVELKGFKNIQSWKAELDQQLYKVLELQYLKSLDTLHLYLPEIHADLIYRNSELQFSPSTEILREKYQQQLKRFLDIPKTFRGVSDSQDVFMSIIDRNTETLSKVDKYTDDLFEQLNGVMKHWRSWLSLGTLDTSQFNSWEQWELHFRASKSFGQEIAKLPSTEERVGCFIIGLSWLRSDLESHNRSYWSQLVSSLKDSIAQDVFKVQQYVDSSTASLNRQPLTVDQIGEADASHADILNQKSEMEGLFEELLRKSQMLASWTREKVDSVNRLQTAWERLHSLLDNYEHIIAKQVETMKMTLNISKENLERDLEKFAAKWEQIHIKTRSGQILEQSIIDLQKHVGDMKGKQEQFQELAETRNKLGSDCKRFNIDEPEFPNYNQLEKELLKEQTLWTPFEEFYKELDVLSKEEWIVFRKKGYRFEEFLQDWQIKLEKTENTTVITKLLQEIIKYQSAAPILKYVRGDDFTEKHWIEVFTLLGMTSKPIDILCLSDFLDVLDALIEHAQQLQALCKRSASEVIVRQALTELEQWDVQCRFILNSHTDCHGKSLMLIKDFKDILNKVGDNQSLLQSVKNSSDYDSFSERAEMWEKRLFDLDEYLTNLAQIQRKWIYLEPIFGSGTLDQEKGRFERLDKDFKYLLFYIARDPRVTALSRYPNLRTILQNLQDQLSRCQNSLDNFLSEKRNKFSRFLFLGDDDLLEIIGQSSKEQTIQNHLKKLFAGIHSVNIDADGKSIEAICSLQGEIVPLSNPVNINQPVEDWLNVLVIEMQSSLKELLLKCLADGASTDPLKYPSQILCLSDNIIFTTKCEQAIASMTLPNLLGQYKAQLNYYSTFEFNENGDNSLSLNNNPDEDYSDVIELKLKALLLDTIHHITVIEHLIAANVVKVNDWNWQKQLRYYSDESGSVSVKMVNAEMEYSYEYLGNQPKLVRTPLTDKCFLTLTQGMHLGMGGNPYGPAGTGKTESVKALGSLLGRQVLVFNCDEGIDAASMGRILSGLVCCGAWGCFDEFNRLDEATLSAVSMHIQPIQNALRLNISKLTLLDQEIEVNKHCGIFITLNPAGGGYGGRNKLPDNLKQLFRPVVMTHPDHEQIATTLLHCDGFKYVNIIGSKLVEVFSCASKLLSKQQHYDWGLRSLRTVLSACGRNIRNYRKSIASTESLTIEIELQLVVKSLWMDTLSKLTYSDSLKFKALISDIFPSINFENTGHETLIAALEESFNDLGLQINNRQIDKCVELYEQLKQRMGVAIVGPPSSGKSTLRNILFNALLKVGKSLKQHIFNPKSMPRNQLLGQVDADTRQWIDGVLTICSLQVTSESLNVWSWIVCDGDVDPEWIESLNSVLDDNKLLSLPSGWRIQFGPNVNFVFESHDLSYASPATISRLGIVYLSEEDVTLGDFITNVFLKQNENTQGLLGRYIQDYFYGAIDSMILEDEFITKSSRLAIARTGLSQLNSIVNKKQFAIGLINGLGGQLTNEGRERFVQRVFEWTGEMQPPSSHFYYYYDKDMDLIANYSNTISTMSVDLIQNDIPLIMTNQVCQTLDCIKGWLKRGEEQNFLLVGPHGSAKTLILENVVKERGDIDLLTVHCSAYLSPQHIIYKLSQCCMIVNSNKGRVYKPKKGHLLVHFKNLQLLKTDQWGTNMLVSFLLQLITYNGLFDNSLEWVGVENVTVVCSLTNANNLSIRFTSAVHILNIGLPSLEDLNIIYNAYLASLIKKYVNTNSTWSNNKTTKLTTTLISIYNEIKNNFTIAHEQHYDFNPHDLTNWCKSIFKYKNDTETDFEIFLLEVFCYEAINLFKDRLVTDNQRKLFDEIISNYLKTQWGKSNLLAAFTKNVFVPILQHTSSNYIPLFKIKMEDWTDIVKKGVLQFERDGEALDILIIPEFLNLTAKIAKALTESRKSLLLVGRAGVGRRSATKTISALQTAKLISPIMSSRSQFNNDLKMAMQQSGLEYNEVYLVLDDNVMNNQDIIDIVNALLNSGEVPGLYTTAEIESLVTGLKDEANRENFEGNLVEFFFERVCRKLHLVVCLESNNSNLSEIISNCPALYQSCNIIWLSEWSNETMSTVPKMLGEKISLRETSTNELQIPYGFTELHNSIKSSIASPVRFISLVKTYIRIYNEKTEVIENKQNKLKAGISKLTEAKTVVAELKMKAKGQQEKLAEKQEKANAALDMISSTMKSANTQKQEMEVLKHQAEKESRHISKRKEEIDEELSEVKPLIEAARAAVGNIKADSLSEIRSLRAPPDVIRDILEGVLRLMGTQDTSWNSMKNFLSKRGVKEDIKSFDASRITPENRQAVERLLNNRGDSFDPKNAKRASVAAAPLAAWVTANVRYSLVLDKIKPLEREQNKLKQNLTNAELQLEELSTGLTDVDTAVGKLKAQLSLYTKEAAEIEISLKAAQDTLATAEGLVEKLTDEYERWKIQFKEFSEELKILPYNCLLAAAFITYLPGESEDDRRSILNKWKEILSNHEDVNKFSLEKFLGSEREQLQWQSEGLSADQLSLQNAVIILKTKISPLLLDPTCIASKWIKKHLNKKTVEVTTQNSPKFLTNLELAIRFGKVLVIEEIEHISPVLFTILRRQFVHQGERKLININGKLVDYHNDFKLLMCCRNAHLQISADLTAIVNIVNFITTPASLSEQLLTSAIKQENPELENKRKELLRQREELQEKQYNLQNQLLEDLANTKDDILQSKSLMTSLNETKASSSAITAALVESTSIHQKLQEEYNIYHELSVFASSLYFATKEFSKTNILYSLSVPAYIRLFLKSLPPLKDINHNTGFFQKTLIQSLYMFMIRGIFKADRIKFALHLCHKMLPRQIPEEEWKVFVGQIFVTNRSESAFEELPSWIPDGCMQSVLLLQFGLPNFYDSLQLNNETVWRKFMEVNECELNVPSHYKITEFQKVLLVQALRPDRLYSTIIQCVSHLISLQNLSPDVLQLSIILKETLATEPILLITESGTDPSVEIKDLALTKIPEENYSEIAMGEGQENRAVNALIEAGKEGRWLVLKNLHLVTSWLPILSQTLQSFEPHKHFRLWLITESHGRFNPVLAQNSFKIAYEIPQGIKNNLLRTYSTWGQGYIEKLNPTGCRLFFILACVHALLQERRTYIPQGWSKFYEFTDIDFTTAIRLTVELWQTQNLQVQWKYLSGLCSDAVYGGRIENIQDLAILESYLKDYFIDEVLSHRWKPLKSAMSLPIYSNYEEYVNVIKQLSDRDLPTYFGLPENIDRTWEKNASSTLISYLQTLNIFESKAKKFVREEWQKKLLPFMHLWKKLNQGHDFVKITIPIPTNNESSLLTFLSEEYSEGIQLVQHIHKCFSTLNRITKKTMVAEPKDLQLANELLTLQTPKTWQNLWNGPTDPNQYLTSVMSKTAFIAKLKSIQDKNYLFQQSINLSLLFHPETFLTAFKQDISRESKIAMNELTLNTSWKPGNVNNIMTLSGLLIEGALFDGYILSPCSSNSQSINSAPDCYINWIQKQQLIENGKIIDIPLYYSNNRSAILAFLQVPCNANEKNKWIQAATAFFIDH